MTVVIFTALQDGVRGCGRPPAGPPAQRGSHHASSRQATFAGDHVDWTVHLAELGAGNMRTAIEITAAVAAL